MNKITAIVLAAGRGKRMNATVAKQFLLLRDKPLIYYSLKVFEQSNVDEIMLVTGEGMVDYCKKEIVERYHINKVVKIIEGGIERYDSVYQGLINVGATDYVLVHDGARPFITVVLVNDIISSVKECKACIVGMPVKETIKEVDDKGMIIKTPDRNTLWGAQTPQAFEYSSLLQVYENFYQNKDAMQAVVTDDAMLYEIYGNHPVKLLLGDYRNIKITTPEDLILAERILASMD